MAYQGTVDITNPGRLDAVPGYTWLVTVGGTLIVGGGPPLALAAGDYLVVNQAGEFTSERRPSEGTEGGRNREGAGVEGGAATA